MGYHQPRLPNIEPDEFLRSTFQERIKFVSKEWGEWGFGAARKISVMYLVKLFGGWLLGGALVITLTSGLNPLDVASWWTNPIVYQKYLVMAMLLDAIGVAGSWGPLAGKFGPYTGGILFWSRPGTIKLSPYKWIPWRGGNRRTIFDVFLYWGFLFSMGLALLSPGQTAADLPALARFQALLTDPANGVPSWLANNAESFMLIQTTPLISAVIFLCLIGMRDKIIFLAARSEQYLLPVVCFIVFPNLFEVTDMVIALKIFLVTVWVGAGFSKLNRHFSPVIPPMLSNTPFWPPRWLKKKAYQDYDNDNLLPGPIAHFFAHVLGTIVEIAAPLTMLFVVGQAFGGQVTVTLATLLMVGFCLFIISTFPIAVPLEWNLLFAICAVVFFIGYPNSAGFSVFDMSQPWMPFSVIAVPVFFVIFGSIRPDKVSFLAALRQYGGNWATGLWAIHPDAEKKLHRVYRPTLDQIDQFQAMGLPYKQAETFLEVSLAWRALHTQGRGLFSIMLQNVPDIDHRRVREGEFACNAMIGFNFGEGHFHDEELIAAIQEQAHFEPGEFIVAWAESEPLWHGYQEYKLIDAALGVVERGRWQVKDAAQAQPWLPDGPLPLTVTWRSPDFDKLRFTATDIIGPDAEPPLTDGTGGIDVANTDLVNVVAEAEEALTEGVKR
ncbi:DUF3556 domain-containing protein [Leucobacter chinensis]|uniref:DUF3556 domain-containing protein n=1 Tax=Leucobacter chinensis TaxID=2851010 RepID=UPI001C21116D|nr:DUF3556 domain-containing protein [Leucobacter chinensis]